MLSFDSLIVGNKYDRPYLAKLWGYKDFHAIARGIVTPKNSNQIIIFITKMKQTTLTQYTDHYEPDNCLLFMEGESNKQNDERLINSIYTDDEIQLFYREVHHTPFQYIGRIYLSTYEKSSGSEPSKFVFNTNNLYAEAYRNICLEENGELNSLDTFTPEDEGKAKLKKHISYERSIKNRAKAIEIHGYTCAVCNFNFNIFFGKELASNFIEIHHIKPISRYEGTVDPATDLVPVCSNCHRMLHKHRNSTLSIEELKMLVEKNKL